jgi:hypothetical protein
MSVYYFHMENPERVHDTAGAELADLESAKCHAVTLIGRALCEHPKGFWDAETYQVTVTDEGGLTLFMVCMMSVIAPALMTKN